MAQDEVARAERVSHDLRRVMVDNQVRTFDVTDQRVLEAFYLIPRDKFLPANLQSLAYSDAQIALKPAEANAESRVLLPPMFLAKLMQGATIDINDRVLLVASATGYAAAILAELTTSVVALESDAAMSGTAAANLLALGLSNVTCVTGPLAKGYAEGAPYDLILVDGAVECNLDALFAQLAPKGRLLTIETMSSGATRRSGKATRFDNVGGEMSARALFDATVPVLPEFRDAPRFNF
ncbi:protein-L-isoaspartate O-methyltransferase family protein [Lichenihabitans psoromatis]|uniref:protein-L-isoaspartate O-methyltransferase family protein n=1 Tax=Lichenihabitans psoromatis TaxID=2528642 RepID=UPI0010384B99|nr:protein-L-isoaspartate O-methyltransferase [Lichenihabitans psoromatis]